MGLLFASFILRDQSNTILQIIKTWISPCIEVFVVFTICQKFYIANKKAKETNSNKIDFLMHCRSVMIQVTGNEKLGNIISSEVAVIYYAFFGSKDKKLTTKQNLVRIERTEF